ncbi:MAG: IS1595 family transposase [Bacteroidota bacterium]|nr:IS1595 family transposase [Bacteroidota bacterium]
MKDIINKYKYLKLYQQKILLKFLNQFLSINIIDTGSISAEGMICRRCGADFFVKNGTYKNNQRYQCKACGSTQFRDANTPLYNLKLKDKWSDFVYIMLDSEQPMTNERISKVLDFDKKTAQRWRHKFLSSLNEVNPLELDEEVEIDEVYLKFCVKGVIGREKYEEYFFYGSPDNVESELRKKEKKMIEEKYQSIFLCQHNRMGDFDFSPIKIQKKGIVSKEDLERVMKELDLSKRTVITDKETSMMSYMNTLDNVNHLTFRSSDIKKGILENKKVHNNNINNTMMLLRGWLKVFRGVSTKYIWNYLKWFRFLNLFKLFKTRQMIGYSLSDKNSYPRFKNIFKTYEEFVYI